VGNYKYFGRLSMADSTSGQQYGNKAGCLFHDNKGLLKKRGIGFPIKIA
jgi:hypothetical protein